MSFDNPDGESSKRSVFMDFRMTYQPEAYGGHEESVHAEVRR